MDLYQDCSYDAPGFKTGPASGGGGITSLNIQTRRKILKLFFSETRKCRALIFGMKHLLVDLYQDCSYDAPGVKTGLAPGVTSSKHRNKHGKLQNFSSLKLKVQSFDIWYVASPSGPLPRLFIWCPWGQNWPRPGGGGGGSQVWNIGTKKENFKIFFLWN